MSTSFTASGAPRSQAWSATWISVATVMPKTHADLTLSIVRANPAHGNDATTLRLMFVLRNGAILRPLENGIHPDEFLAQHTRGPRGYPPSWISLASLA